MVHLRRPPKILDNYYGRNIPFEGEHNFSPAKESRHMHSYIIQLDYEFEKGNDNQ